MKYIKLLLIALTFTFVGVTAISPVHAGEITTTNPYFNDTDEVGKNFCDEPSVRNVLRFLGFFLQIARLVVPIILIVQGTFTFFKAVTADADTELKKSAYAFGRKIAVGILVFFVPTLLDAIFGFFSLFSSVETDYATCKDCLLSPGKCKTTGSTTPELRYSENCSALSVTECPSYSNCIVQQHGGTAPVCEQRADAPRHADNCSVISYSDCSKYYNCEVVPPAAGSSSGPTCGPKKNLQ